MRNNNLAASHSTRLEKKRKNIAMDYREYPVPATLQRHIRCVWHLRDDAPASAPQTVYPDGHCELIVHRAQPMRAFEPIQGWQWQTTSLFAGQHCSPIRLAATGRLDCVGVRLQPAASAIVAGAQLPALRDRIVDLSTLDAAFASQLIAACEPIPSLNSLWAVLSARIHDYVIDARIEAAVAHLQAEQGQLRIEPLAQQAAMSLRSFQSRFLQCVGLTAKEFARVQRLQATLQELDNGDQPLSALAAAQGFADQAHATRELQHFTGLTPARLRTALHQQRDSDTTIALAAAFVRGHSQLSRGEFA